jgi:predicted heme/steroid binding protein
VPYHITSYISSSCQPPRHSAYPLLQRGAIQLTPAELSLYNGTSPDLPIYLSINQTIFDVSASPQTYGPGGSYHVFAGRDATRAFVTGCFADDTTSDLRGAEEIYIPIEPTPGDDQAVDEEERKLSSAEKKMRAERERREAKKRVRKEVEKWETFYRDSKKYFEVGKLVGVGEYTGPVPTLCASAQKGRPKRKKLNKKQSKDEAPGKPVH